MTIRDLELFPHDDMGNMLWRMAVDGDNLTLPRMVDFSIVFGDPEPAEAFRASMAERGYIANIRQFPEQEAGLTWDVTVSHLMVPAHAVLSAFESMLAKEAADGGGVNDGWGCFQEAWRIEEPDASLRELIVELARRAFMPPALPGVIIARFTQLLLASYLVLMRFARRLTR